MTVHLRHTNSAMVGEPNTLMDPDLSVRREYTSNAEAFFHRPRRMAGEYNLSPEAMAILPPWWVGAEVANYPTPPKLAATVAIDSYGISIHQRLELLLKERGPLNMQEIALETGTDMWTARKRVERLRKQRRVVIAGKVARKTLYGVPA